MSPIKMSTDCLIEVPRQDWPKLRDLYIPGKSRSYIAYTALESYIQWITLDADVKHVKVYALNGDFSDGTFAIIDRYCAYVDTFDESIESLGRLLRLLDYSKGLWFMSERSVIRPVIYEILEEKNMKVPSNGVISLELFRLTKEKALNFDVSPKAGIEIRPLDVKSDLERTSSEWPYRTSTTLPFFERIIKYNETMGAYDENGKLLSWILRYPTGLLASLYTDKGHLGQGLALLVTRNLCKRIAELGYDSFSGILTTNQASLNLFRKLGFVPYDQIDWISTEISWNTSDE